MKMNRRYNIESSDEVEYCCWEEIHYLILFGLTSWKNRFSYKEGSELWYTVIVGPSQYPLSTLELATTGNTGFKILKGLFSGWLKSRSTTRGLKLLSFSNQVTFETFVKSPIYQCQTYGNCFVKSFISMEGWKLRILETYITMKTEQGLVYIYRWLDWLWCSYTYIRSLSGMLFVIQNSYERITLMEDAMQGCQRLYTQFHALLDLYNVDRNRFTATFLKESEKLVHSLVVTIPKTAKKLRWFQLDANIKCIVAQIDLKSMSKSSPVLLPFQRQLIHQCQQLAVLLHKVERIAPYRKRNNSPELQQILCESPVTAFYRTCNSPNHDAVEKIKLMKGYKRYLKIIQSAYAIEFRTCFSGQRLTASLYTRSSIPISKLDALTLALAIWHPLIDSIRTAIRYCSDIIAKLKQLQKKQVIIFEETGRNENLLSNPLTDAEFRKIQEKIFSYDLLADLYHQTICVLLSGKRFASYNNDRRILTNLYTHNGKVQQYQPCYVEEACAMKVKIDLMETQLNRIQDVEFHLFKTKDTQYEYGEEANHLHDLHDNQAIELPVINRLNLQHILALEEQMVRISLLSLLVQSHLDNATERIQTWHIDCPALYYSCWVPYILYNGRQILKTLRLSLVGDNSKLQRFIDTMKNCVMDGKNSTIFKDSKHIVDYFFKTIGVYLTRMETELSRVLMRFDFMSHPDSSLVPLLQILDKGEGSLLQTKNCNEKDPGELFAFLDEKFNEVFDKFQIACNRHQQQQALQQLYQQPRIFMKHGKHVSVVTDFLEEADKMRYLDLLTVNTLKFLGSYNRSVQRRLSSAAEPSKSAQFFIICG